MIKKKAGLLLASDSVTCAFGIKKKHLDLPHAITTALATYAILKLHAHLCYFSCLSILIICSVHYMIVPATE